MTQEEKAKAYDKALEKARQLCAYPTTKPFISDFQDLFPELKEREDERIRKAIIGYIDHGQHYGVSNKDMIAWLEKQGEKKHTDKVEPKFKVGDIVVVKPMVCHGEIVKGKPFEIVDITDDDYISDNGKFYSISLQDGWELVEQNLADKVEPKFHKGEWITIKE